VTSADVRNIPLDRLKDQIGVPEPIVSAWCFADGMRCRRCAARLRLYLGQFDQHNSYRAVGTLGRLLRRHAMACRQRNDELAVHDDVAEIERAFQRIGAVSERGPVDTSNPAAL